MPPVLWRGWIPFADVRRKKRCEISRWCYSLPDIRHRDGNNRQPEYPLYPSGVFYPASPVEIVVSLSLTFSVLLCFLWGQLWDGFRCLKYITPHDRSE